MAANPTRVKRIAFGISIATASVAGALLIIQPVEPSVGRDYIGRIFAICVLGGMTSFPGMVAGALLIGIVESLTATFYGPSSGAGGGVRLFIADPRGAPPPAFWDAENGSLRLLPPLPPQLREGAVERALT